MKRINLAGAEFGRLTVKKYIADSKWECVCSCGVIKAIDSYSLRRGITQSCGCLHGDVIKQRNTVHSAHGTKAYRVWSNMKDRCINPNNKAYHRYGGRGITVCKRWMEFINFLEDMGQPPRGLTLDRIDNDEGYNKSNCRWATVVDQAKNRITTTTLTAFGETKSFMEWARDSRCKVSHLSLRQRINTYGWEVEKAIATPMQMLRRKMNKADHGETVHFEMEQ